MVPFCARKALFALLSAVVVVGFAPRAEAVTVYTDRATWEAAMLARGASITTDTFSNDKPNADTITFDTGVVSVGLNGTTANRILFGLFAGDVDTDGDGNLFDRYDQLTWTFPSPIIGFGALWYSPANGEILHVTADFDGTGPTKFSFLDELGDVDPGFLGFIGEADFSSAVFTSGDGPGSNTNQFFYADDLSFGTAIPEPTSLMLLGTAGAGLLLCRPARTTLSVNKSAIRVRQRR